MTKHQRIIEFALERLIISASGAARNASRDKHNRVFPPGALDQFLRDAEDAKRALISIRQESPIGDQGKED